MARTTEGVYHRQLRDCSRHWRSRPPRNPAELPRCRKINIGVSVARPMWCNLATWRRRWHSRSAASTPIVRSRAASRRRLRSQRAGLGHRPSATYRSAAAEGAADWALAPRMPQAYMVPGEIKTAADLKGKRLSATGGGVGGFNWRMGREVLKSSQARRRRAQFIPSPTAAACLA